MDFVVKDGISIGQLIQSCYDPTDFDAKRRETDALIKASRELKCRNLLVITNDYEAEEIEDGRKIRFIPLWKWLLSEEYSKPTK